MVVTLSKHGNKVMVKSNKLLVTYTLEDNEEVSFSKHLIPAVSCFPMTSKDFTLQITGESFVIVDVPFI
jgi:hypothetical protein